MVRLGAIVLAGGRGSRLGGVDKGALRLGGDTLIERALDALEGVPTVVVGPAGRWWESRPVTVVREDPPFAGPAAAVVTGLAALQTSADEVLLLAVDVPELPAVVPLLLAGASGRDGVVALDGEGRRQWLLGRYRAAALRDAASALGTPAGASLHALLGHLDLAPLPLPPRLAADVDTVEDARAAGVTLPADAEEAR